MGPIIRCASCDADLDHVLFIGKSLARVNFCSYICQELFDIRLSQMTVEEKGCRKNLNEMFFKHMKINEIAPISARLIEKQKKL